MFILSQKYRCEELITIRGEGQVCLSDCQMGGVSEIRYYPVENQKRCSGVCVYLYTCDAHLYCWLYSRIFVTSQEKTVSRVSREYSC